MANKDANFFNMASNSNVKRNHYQHKMYLKPYMMSEAFLLILKQENKHL